MGFSMNSGAYFPNSPPTAAPATELPIAIEFAPSVNIALPPAIPTFFQTPRPGASAPVTPAERLPV